MPESAKDDARQSKITVVLLQRHIAALDQLSVSIRLRTVSRSRALASSSLSFRPRAVSPAQSWKGCFSGEFR